MSELNDLDDFLYSFSTIKNTCISSIITTSFMEKAELEQQLKPHIHYSDYNDLLDALWQPLIEKAYSFVVKDENERIIGVALNFDANDEPEAPLVGGLCTIFIFLDFLEIPIK